MANMTISTGRAKDAPSVTVEIPEPTTFNDPQWNEWNMDEADICKAAVRTVRVDIANGGARDTLREVVERFPKDATKWLAPVAEKVRTWKRGVQKSAATKILDARTMDLSDEQVAHFEAQGYKVLTD